MSLGSSKSMGQVASEVTRESRRPKTVGRVMTELDHALKEGDIAGRQPQATGFEALDRVMSGGLKAGELTLIGGAQGVGKTTMTLQMARNLAANGAHVLYVCYEHDERFLVNRLLSMESLDTSSDDFNAGMRLRDIVSSIERTGAREDASLRALGQEAPILARSGRRVAGYADRLLLLRGSATYTDLAALASELVILRDLNPDAPCVLFVDYLQKVPVHPETQSEEDRVTRVVEGLKDLSLSLSIPVVAIVAADIDGLKAQRLRIHHLRGGSSILYEADVILILNEKHRIVTKNSLTFNPHEAEAYHNWVICSIEKNRGGRQLIDLEFRKRFQYACFDPEGRPVTEMLIDERIQPD